MRNPAGKSFLFPSFACHQSACTYTLQLLFFPPQELNGTKKVFFRLSSVNKYFRPFRPLERATQYNFPALSLTHNLEKVLMARCESNLGRASRRDKYIISHSQRAPFFCLEGGVDDNCALAAFLISLCSLARFLDNRTLSFSILLKTFNGAILKEKANF